MSAAGIAKAIPAPVWFYGGLGVVAYIVYKNLPTVGEAGKALNDEIFFNDRVAASYALANQRIADETGVPDAELFVTKSELIARIINRLKD